MSSRRQEESTSPHLATTTYRDASQQNNRRATLAKSNGRRKSTNAKVPKTVNVIPEKHSLQAQAFPDLALSQSKADGDDNTSSALRDRVLSAMSKSKAGPPSLMTAKESNRKNYAKINNASGASRLSECTTSYNSAKPLAARISGQGATVRKYEDAELGQATTARELTPQTSEKINQSDAISSTPAAEPKKRKRATINQGNTRLRQTKLEAEFVDNVEAPPKKRLRRATRTSSSAATLAPAGSDSEDEYLPQKSKSRKAKHRGQGTATQSSKMIKSTK